jgi:hypothetical protein
MIGLVDECIVGFMKSKKKPLRLIEPQENKRQPNGWREAPPSTNPLIQ